MLRLLKGYVKVAEEENKSLIVAFNAMDGQSHYHVRTPVRGWCMGAAAPLTKSHSTGVPGLAVTPASVTSPIVSKPSGVHRAPGPLAHLASGTLPINLLSFVIYLVQLSLHMNRLDGMKHSMSKLTI